MSESPARDVIVVTGGSRGIGAAVVRLLAERRSDTAMIVGYRSDEAAARSLADEVGRTAGSVAAGESDGTGTSITAVPVRCDVSVPTDVEALFREADRHGRLVGLVNSAGILHQQGPLTGIDAARWREVLAVNVVGTALACREAVARMAAHDAPSRSIVNLSSIAATLGAPNEYVDYAASKAAVDTLTRGLALEVAGDGIRVNAVRPGIIETEIHALGGEPGRADRIGPTLPLGRAGRPEEVAEAVVWLLSDAASFVTGTFVDVSGGR